MPLGLMLAAHDQPDNVTWYVTPMEMGGPSYDIPGDNRMCELIEGTDNVIIALPSGLVGPWLNATTTWDRKQAVASAMSRAAEPHAWAVPEQPLPAIKQMFW